MDGYAGAHPVFGRCLSWRWAYTRYQFDLQRAQMASHEPFFFFFSFLEKEKPISYYKASLQASRGRGPCHGVTNHNKPKEF